MEAMGSKGEDRRNRAIVRPPCAQLRLSTVLGLTATSWGTDW
jgi:hypothetical protein